MGWDDGVRDGVRGRQRQRADGSTVGGTQPQDRWPGKTTLVDRTLRSARAPAPSTPGKRALTDGLRADGVGAPQADRSVRLYDVYFDIYRRDLIDAVKDQLAQAQWPDPAADLPWARSGDRRFAAAVFEAMRARIAHWDGHQLSPLLFPGDPAEAFRRFVARDHEQLEHAAWSAEFGDAFAQLVERAVRTSVQARMGPRYRAALGQMVRPPTAQDLIAGHPIDPIVAAAMAQPGNLDLTGVAADKDVGPPKLHAVTARWLGRDDVALWNFVEVQPASATVEDVAAALWKDSSRTTNAYALTKIGDLFRVAPGHARSLLHRLYPGEPVGVSDSDTSKAHQIYALSRSHVGAEARQRVAASDPHDHASPRSAAPAAARTPATSARPAHPAKPGATPSIAQTMEVERAIGDELATLRAQVAPFGLSALLAPAFDARAARVLELASGDPATIERWIPILQFQHTQLLTIAPRIAPIVERLRPLAYVPVAYLDDGKRKQREQLQERLSSYVRAAAVSDDRTASTAILTSVVGKEKHAYVDQLDEAQTSLRQAVRQGADTREGAPREAGAAAEQLARQREAAMGGKQSGRAEHEQKKALIRAGEVSLRSRMRAVEQSLVQLREAAAKAGFADPAVLRRLMPNAKTLPEVLADVHDHLRDVDHTWQQAMSAFTPEVLPADAPDDLAEWQEREAGLEAARGAFVKISGDQDIGTFLREARDKIKDQRMWHAITSVATALLITLATGMGAAALADAVAGALVTEASAAAAQLFASGVNIAINASINSVVQLALADNGKASFWMALLENSLMELFTRGLMKPLKNAEALAAREAQQLSHLPGLSNAEREAVISSASFAGAHLLAEGVGGMATQWAAQRIVQIVHANKEEVSEPFAVTVLQQGAALGMGRFFAARLAAWQKHRAQLASTRFGEIPEMRALIADREAFYARAEALAKDVSPDPAAGPALATRNTELLAHERVILAGPGHETTVPLKERGAPSDRGAATEAGHGHGVQPHERASQVHEGHTPGRGEQAAGTAPAAERVVLAGDDVRMKEAARRAKPRPGFADVIVHADADSFWVIRADADIRLDQRSLATYLKKFGLAGKKIRLIACEAGLTPFAVAQHLANKLHVEVLAPTATAWIDGNGTVGVGPANEHAGRWEPFKPRPSSADGAKPMHVVEQPHVEPTPGAPEVAEPLGVRFDHRERYGSSNHDELQAKLGKPLIPDASLGDGVNVTVRRTKGRFFGFDHVVDSVRVGTEARAHDVLAHAELIKLVERYNGALGSLRKVIDWFRAPDGGRYGAAHYPHGSRGWVLATEIEKLQVHIENTRLERERGQIDATIAAQEIAHLRGAEAYFREELRAVDPHAFDPSFELARKGVGQSTDEAKAAGYRLPGEPGAEVPGGAAVDPAWYYYSRSAADPAVFELARKPSAPSEAPQLQARVVGGAFQGIRLPEREPAALVSSIAKGDELPTLYKPGLSMDRFAQMLESHGFASRAVIDGVALHYHRELLQNPRATMDDWRHAVKEHFKQRVLERITDPKLDEAASYRMMREVVDGLANADRGNLVEDWYRGRYAPGGKRQAYRVERTSGANEGKHEDRVADVVVDGEIREIKDVDGPIDEGQLDAHLDAVRDDKLSKSLGAKKVRYVFTKEAGALANESLMMSRFESQESQGLLTVEVVDRSGTHHYASNLGELTQLFAQLRAMH